MIRYIDFSFGASRAESARDEESFDLMFIDECRQFLLSLLIFKGFGIEKMYFDFGAVHRPCMLQSFYDAEIAIIELGIFSGQCDMQRLLRMAYVVDERLSVL